MQNRKRFLKAAAAAERAAASVGSEREYAAAFEALRYMEEIQVAQLNAALDAQAKTSLRRKECLPVRESGDDIGFVQAKIPKKVAFQLMAQKNFGWEGLMSDEGMRDVLKEYPQFGVKTVSGKVTVGYQGSTESRPTGRKRGAAYNTKRGGAVFGRGTLVLAG